MTREEKAIAFFKDMNEYTYGNLEAVEMAIKALEQGLILDKARAEIADVADCDAYTDVQQAFNDGLWEAVKIIDKYKVKSEV